MTGTVLAVPAVWAAVAAPAAARALKAATNRTGLRIATTLTLARLDHLLSITVCRIILLEELTCSDGYCPYCTFMSLPSMFSVCSRRPLLVNPETISTVQELTAANRSMDPQVRQGVEHNPPSSSVDNNSQDVFLSGLNCVYMSG